MLKTVLLLLLALFALLFASGSIKLGFNSTVSEPLGWYLLVSPWYPLARGELVVFILPQIPWIKARHYIHRGEHLLKSVGAVPGEWLFNVAGRIFACPNAVFAHYRSQSLPPVLLIKHCRRLGQCLRRDHNGAPVFCQLWHGWRIPQDYYYLQSRRVPNSLDSRYFGVVHRRQILYRLLPWQGAATVQPGV